MIVQSFQRIYREFGYTLEVGGGDVLLSGVNASAPRTLCVLVFLVVCVLAVCKSTIRHRDYIDTDTTYLQSLGHLRRDESARDDRGCCGR